MLISKSLKIMETGLDLTYQRNLFTQINLNGTNPHLRGQKKDRIMDPQEENTQEKESMINMEIGEEKWMKSIIKEDACFLAWSL